VLCAPNSDGDRNVNVTGKSLPYNELNFWNKEIHTYMCEAKLTFFFKSASFTHNS
jgi:hypothetical protein